MFTLLLRLWRLVFARPAPALTDGDPHAAAYREAAIVDVPPRPGRAAAAPPVLWRFTHVCHLCGHDVDVYGNALVRSRVCGQTKRVPVGVFRRCKVPGIHVHQKCRGCGGEWLSTPPSNVGALR
jgi:hypothetical protein